MAERLDSRDNLYRCENCKALLASAMNPAQTREFRFGALGAILIATLFILALRFPPLSSLLTGTALAGPVIVFLLWRADQDTLTPVLRDSGDSNRGRP